MKPEASTQDFITKVMKEVFPSVGSMIEGNGWSIKFKAFQALIANGVVDKFNIPDDMTNAYVSSGSANHKQFQYLFRLNLLRVLEKRVADLLIPSNLAFMFSKWVKDQDKAFEDERRDLFPPSPWSNYKIPVVLFGLAVCVHVSRNYVNNKIEQYAEEHKPHHMDFASFKVINDAVHAGVATTLSLSAGVMSLWHTRGFNPFVSRNVKIITQMDVTRPNREPKRYDSL